ncbi:IclR family transcriptional regulator C-terminal domain-containing protein [Streptomyces sp. NPDC012794]|uniref:IclR family transcriptional regulator domain-containing protein n=1 Tax=Streptomyces sp. NPDC012794 TaxID=3364850 RepID=UPI0036AD1B55
MHGHGGRLGPGRDGVRRQEATIDRDGVLEKAATHASAIGKSLLTQFPSDMRTDHLKRYGTARLTRRTITDARVLSDTLERLTCNQPVFDLREYANKTVCSAVGVNTGTEAGSLALAMPLADAHRLKHATHTLARKAIPVLLTLLISGGITL